MPLLEIKTNLPKEKIPKDFVKKAVQVTSEVTTKPVEYCAAHVAPDQLFSFAGTDEPAASVIIRCIGTIKDPEHSPVIAQKLTDFISSELGIAKKRFYIFYDLRDFDDVAFGGILFTELKQQLGL